MTDAATGDATPETIAALVANHRRFLAFLERRVGSRADAEDILQAAFVRGLQRAGEIRDEERVVPWFYRLLRNAIVDHWRTRATEQRGTDGYAREVSAREAAEPELEAEICRCFEGLLSTLRPEQAAILRKVALEGARPVDVATAIGITPNLAMVRLHRARQALRERLTQTCRTCADHGCLDCSCRSGPPSAAAGL
jgi:RNA polymerase sigma factor (sigma-70 family)